MFFCPLCNSFGSHSLSALLRHIGEIHQYDSNFRIQCGLQQCPQTYSNFQSYRKHRDVLFIQQTESSFNDSENVKENRGESNSDSHSSNRTHPDPAYRTPDDDNTDDSSERSTRIAAAKFVMKTRKEYRLPQSTVNALITDVDELCSSAIGRMKNAFFAQIEDLENSDTVRALFLKSLEEISSPFVDFNTQYKQSLYFKEQHLDYLVRIVLTEFNAEFL